MDAAHLLSAVMFIIPQPQIAKEKSQPPGLIPKPHEQRGPINVERLNKLELVFVHDRSNDVNRPDVKASQCTNALLERRIDVTPNQPIRFTTHGKMPQADESRSVKLKIPRPHFSSICSRCVNGGNWRPRYFRLRECDRRSKPYCATDKRLARQKG